MFIESKEEDKLPFWRELLLVVIPVAVAALIPAAVDVWRELKDDSTTEELLEKLNEKLAKKD